MNNPQNVNEYKVLLLAPNLEAIGKLLETGPDYFILEHTLIVRPVPMGDGSESYGLQMLPISPTNPEGKTKFYKTQFMGEHLEIPDQLVAAYRERTSSIVMSSAVDAFADLTTTSQILRA